jgi:ABC-2 type transport system permease protein
MTALAIPAAPQVRRSSLTRLTTTRLSYGLLAASIGLTVLWTTLEASRAGTPNGPAPLTGYAGQTAIITGGVWGLILAAVLGATISSGEFRHHTATLTYLATPARGRVLAAKMAAGAIGGAVFGAIGYILTLVIGLSVAHSPTGASVTSWVPDCSACSAWSPDLSSGPSSPR